MRADALRWLRRLLVGALFAGLAGALLWAMATLPPPSGRLPDAVAASMAESGVTHPVTAVLLNFRGYDTLLEVAVLLLALFGILALGRGESGARPDTASPVLQTLARGLVPLMVLVAGYLLWAGAFRPGGAFQAGAVLAAAAALMHLAGLLPAWDTPRVRLRLGLTAGFFVFLLVAAALLAGGALLRYPPERAGSLILLIEAGLTVSLGLVLAALFLFLSDKDGRP